MNPPVPEIRISTEGSILDIREEGTSIEELKIDECISLFSKQ